MTRIRRASKRTVWLLTLAMFAAILLAIVIGMSSTGAWAYLGLPPLLMAYGIVIYLDLRGGG